MKARTLLMLSTMRSGLPDLPPRERMQHPRCREFSKAALLCLSERYADAMAVMVNAQTIRAPIARGSDRE